MGLRMGMGRRMGMMKRKSDGEKRRCFKRKRE
jgi:hypothetical protein